MNKIYTIGIILICFFASTAMQAQDRPGREKIKALKVAFITERLNLSTEEAQQFWPIYNNHEQDIENIKRKERTEFRQRFANFDALSDSDAQDLLNSLIALEKEKHRLNVTFIERMSSVISARKTMLLIKAEEDFKKRLLREMQERRNKRN